jgi:carbamoyl-phosphate synthase large subunit
MELGFHIVATEGTRKALKDHGVDVELILKLHEGRPNVMDAIKNKKIQLIINTPSGEEARVDGRLLRRSALAYKVPIITTLSGAKAAAAAIGCEGIARLHLLTRNYANILLNHYL